MTSRMSSCPSSALQQMVNQRQLRSAAQFWSPSRSVEVAQSVNQNGSVVSTFRGLSGVDASPSGLGWLQTSWCDKYGTALDLLGEVVKRASTAGVNTPNLDRAALRWEAENSVTGRNFVSFIGCSDETANLMTIIRAAQADLQPANRVPEPPVLTVVANTANADAGNAGKPPEEMSPTAKFAIIGGITVAGIIGIAVITGQLAPLLRTVKAAF